MLMRAKWAVAVSALPLVAGCAQWNTAYRQRTIPADKPGAITVDAKQRSVFINPVAQTTTMTTTTMANEAGLSSRSLAWVNVPIGTSPVNGSSTTTVNHERNLRLCAEPAPDVFAAIAASGSALINVDVKTQSGGLNLAGAFSETAATIERTQTVNLLRESFYRTCERYLSGAITKESFIIQAGRDARAMVAVLAIEQLTGALRRPSTIISGPATAAQANAMSEVVKLYTRAYQEKEDIRGALEGLQDKAKKSCGATPPESSCDADKAAVTAKQAKLKEAEGRVSELRSAMDAAAGNNAGATTVAGATLPGGTGESTGGGGNNSNNVAAIATNVENIVKEITEQDEMRLLCIELIARNGIYNDPDLKRLCFTLLQGAVNLSLARVEAQTTALYDKIINLDQNTKKLANYLSNNQVFVAKWNALVESSETSKNNPQWDLKAKPNASLNEIINKFRTVPDETAREEILKGIPK